jgi:hypothetical protein
MLGYMNPRAFEEQRLAKGRNLIACTTLAQGDAERWQVQAASRTGDVSTPAMIDASTH